MTNARPSGRVAASRQPPAGHDVGPLRLRCHSYTHARRFPLVVGKIGGYALPTPLTPAQVAALLGSAGALLLTRELWSVLPGRAELLVAVGLPLLLTWLVRHARIEGRPPLRAAVGFAAYALRPRLGVRRGRPVRPGRPQRLRG